MRKNKLFCRSVTAGIIAAMALILSCAKDSEKKNEDLLPILALAMVTEDARSYDALPLVPASLASTKDTGSSSSQSVINDVVPQGTTTNRLKQIYTPVRSSVLIGKELVKLAGQIITKIESLITQYPTLAAGATIAYTDNSDSAHPGRVVKLTADSTFGSGGYKVEVWWTDTGSDTLRDGKKILELIYLKNSSTGDTDGVLFFRYLPTTASTSFSLVRVEFKKAVIGTEITRTAYVYVENYIDFRNNTGANAAFFINENAQGIVTVEGGYTVKGLLAPFLENNSLAGWGATDDRVYLFNGAGSIASGKAVVNVVLPLKDDILTATPFVDGQAWSLGELFTDGLLNYLNITNVSNGTSTILAWLNTLTLGTLSTGTSQADLIVFLNAMSALPWVSTNVEALNTINSLKIITGIKNPVYFQKGVFSVDLVGQDNTTGLTGAADYAALEALLSANFTWFAIGDLFNLSIANGTTIDVMSSHSTIVNFEKWNGIADFVPSI